MQNRDKSYNLSSHVLVGIIIFIIFSFIIIPIQSNRNEGFSTELIHINSPLSPFFSPNLTSHGLLKHTEEIGSSSLINDRSLYLMKISYGNPKVKYYHIVDTGSELSWIQCLPCTHCYHSEYAPFNHTNSKSFRFEKGSENETLPYEINYMDSSHSRGELARDTIMMGSGFHKIKFEKFLFGCGHDNIGSFPNKSGGLVGFNLRERSFISQLSEKHHGKFSYCMAPYGSSRAGKISFGHKGIVSGNDVMTTPLVLDSFYNIMLDAVTVGTQRLKYFSDSYLQPNDSGQVNDQLKLMIDSGSSILVLSNSFFTQVQTTVQKFIKTKSPVRAHGNYKLCYSSSLMDGDIPKIKLHFPGVVLELSPLHTFVPNGEQRCLAILPKNGTSILGNLAQVNFLVGFDLVEKEISFKPTNCARL